MVTTPVPVEFGVWCVRAGLTVALAECGCCRALVGVLEVCV